MADNNNISPEEKLFNIIQKSEKVTNNSEESTQENQHVDKVGLFAKLRHYFESYFHPAYIKDNGFSVTTFLHTDRIDIKLLNKAFIVILIFLSSYIVFYVIGQRQNVSTIINAISSVKLAPVIGKKSVEWTPLGFYLSKVRKRNIFESSPLETKNLKRHTAPTITKLKKSLKLVGIYWGEYTEVMIEDTDAGRTYFLKAGDEIKGTVIKKILKDSIILVYDNQEFQLM